MGLELLPESPPMGRSGLSPAPPGTAGAPLLLPEKARLLGVGAELCGLDMLLSLLGPQFPQSSESVELVMFYAPFPLSSAEHGFGPL